MNHRWTFDVTSRHRTLLLLSIIHPDFKDGRALVAQQGDRAGGGVQLVNAAAAVLVPEQEVFIVAQAEGVVQLLIFVHRLVMSEKQPKQQIYFYKRTQTVYCVVFFSFFFSRSLPQSTLIIHSKNKKNDLLLFPSTTYLRTVCYKSIRYFGQHPPLL